MLLYNNAEELNTLLNEGVAEFMYRKKDGTIRLAHGTLNPALISVLSGRDYDKCFLDQSGKYVHYFDTDAKDVRCFFPISVIWADNEEKELKRAAELAEQKNKTTKNQ